MTVKHKPFKALHTTRIAIRNDVVRAIRVTSANYKSVAEWCGGRAFAEDLDDGFGDIRRRIYVRTPFGTRVAQLGDYVVRNDEFKGVKLRNGHIGKSRWFVGKADIFEPGFELEK